MIPRPAHLGPGYASQFRDASVVAAYGTRPPYPGEVFDVLASLALGDAPRFLELGCGSGDLTHTLAARAGHVDAVDPSDPMLGAARARRAPVAERVTWHACAAEDFAYAGPYDLAVAAESLHWMEWSVVLPRVAASLHDGGVLAIVLSRELIDLPWARDLAPPIARWSTNREYATYDLVHELTSRGLFRETGRRVTRPVRFQQSVDDYVASFHSRNGFSRDRMPDGTAEAFDGAVRELVSPHCPEGVVRGYVVATVVWGTPLAG